MENMEHTPIVKEVTKRHMGKVHGNAKRNEEMVMNYLKLLANGIVKKRLSPYEAQVLRERKMLSGIFLLPVATQSHQIKISMNRKQI